MGQGRYQVVFFDVGGTLAWAEPGADELWVRALEEHGYTVTSEEVIERSGTQGPEVNRPDVIRALRATQAEFRGPFPRNLEEEAAFFRRYDEALLRRLGIPVDEAILDTVQKHFREDLVSHVYNDVRPTLARLRADGYRLGVISNATHDLPARLESLDLARHFEAITYSYAVGAEKPDPKIFRTALARARVRPEHAVHVGDHPIADVQGAAGVGMTPMLIDRDGAHDDVEGIVLRSLGEIWDHL